MLVNLWPLYINVENTVEAPLYYDLKLGPGIIILIIVTMLLCNTRYVFHQAFLCFKIWFLGDGEFENENIDRPLINHPFHTNLILHKVNKKRLLWVCMNLQMEQKLPIIFSWFVPTKLVLWNMVQWWNYLIW